MRIIDHLIVGQSGGGGGRTGDVFDPNTGQVQASVTLGTQADLDRAIAAAQAAQTGLGGDQSAAPRARDVQVQGAG